MDLGWNGRVVNVTGGASNVGRAISLGFADEGARVLIADVDLEQAKRVEAEAPGGTVVARQADVTDMESISSAVEFAVKSLGGADVLVNCAGWTIDPLFMEKPRSEWRRATPIYPRGSLHPPPAV